MCVSQISERERKELTDLKVSRDHLHPSAVVNVKAWFLFTFITELAEREKEEETFIFRESLYRSLY